MLLCGNAKKQRFMKNDAGCFTAATALAPMNCRIGAGCGSSSGQARFGATMHFTPIDRGLAPMAVYPERRAGFRFPSPTCRSRP
jgi:hypothetical protein